MSLTASRVMLGLFVAAQLLVTGLSALAIYFVAGFRGGTDELIVLTLVLGVPFAQISLLGAWSALGSGQGILRSIGTLFLGVIVCLLIFGSAMSDHVSGGIFVPGLAMFTQWAIFQIPLLTLRISFGWHMELQHASNAKESLNELQFGIRHLLIWTTLVAVVMGAGRLLLSGMDWSSQNMIGFGLFLVFNCLFSWPILLSAFTKHRPFIVLFAAAIFAAAITAAEPVVFGQFMKTTTGERQMFWWTNSFQFLWLAGSVFALRQFGVRLVTRAK